MGNPDSGDAREELASVAASLRAYLEWQQDTGAMGIPRKPRSAKPAVDAPGADVGHEERRAAPSPSPAPKRATAPLDVPVPVPVPAPVQARPVAAPPRPLPVIAAEASTCTKCALSATRNSVVFSRGNPEAKLVFIGEAPGADEDEQGLPFVGRAGQLLTKIIGAINLTRDDVFIANVLKHRPPGNRNPLPDEVAACSPYLVRQIELVRPKVILALGTFAAQTLLETKTTIGKLRGQIHRYYGVPLIVTYHPAALLRNPAWKRPTWEDVQLARRILDRTDSPRA